MALLSQYTVANRLNPTNRRVQARYYKKELHSIMALPFTLERLAFCLQAWFSRVHFCYSFLFHFWRKIFCGYPTIYRAATPTVGLLSAYRQGVSVLAGGEVLDPPVVDGVRLTQRGQVHALREAGAQETEQLLPRSRLRQLYNQLSFIWSLFQIPIRLQNSHRVTYCWHQTYHQVLWLIPEYKSLIFPRWKTLSTILVV